MPHAGLADAEPSRDDSANRFMRGVGAALDVRPMDGGRRDPPGQAEVYRGHGKRDIGDVYERYEVSAYLREDAERMRGQLGPQKLALAQ